MCATIYRWRHLVKAIEVTTGLAESNGSLPLGEWLKVPCGLTVQQDQPRAQFCGKTNFYTKWQFASNNKTTITPV